MKIGILTDIHENVPMLHEALRMADVHRCDELACLGDIIGYDRRFYKYHTDRSAAKCLDLVRSNCRWIVAGNHDLFASGRLPAYTNGFTYPGKWFSMNSHERKKAAQGKVWCYEGDDPNDLKQDHIAYLKSLPENKTALVNDVKILFSHYIFPDFSGSITTYINSNYQLTGLWKYMEDNSVMYSFSGHSHNSFAGFAYRKPVSLLKAVHFMPTDNFNLDDEMLMTLLPPLSGDKGKAAFSIFDTGNRTLTLIRTHITQVMRT